MGILDTRNDLELGSYKPKQNHCPPPEIVLIFKFEQFNCNER